MIDKTQNPAEIYLVPVFDGDHDHVWCDTPAPGEGMREEDATRYVRADLVPASNEMLARRIVELTETVTVLGNQLAAKPSDSGYQALIHERDILKADKERLEAQVKRFADAYIHLLGMFGAIPAKAATDVILERKRQFNIEGWSHEHDDQHDTGELAAAASCYANYTQAYPESDPPPHWPWSKDWWKPKDKRSNLVRAGALILAEIERLDRSTKGGN